VDPDVERKFTETEVDAELIREEIRRMKARLAVLEEEQRDLNRRLDEFAASLEGVTEP
jgi:hypothetical protein